MRIRWREHGLILITVLVAFTVIGDILDMYHLTAGPTTLAYEMIKSRFIGSFNYSTNILLPQIGALLSVYLCYLWINRLLVPFARKISSRLSATAIIVRIAWIIFQLLLAGYFFALSINVASLYAHPHYYNYAGFQLFALLGFNDHPLTNAWTGFGNAMLLVLVYSIYISIRETVIYLIEKNTTGRSYRILIINRITACLVFYITVPFFITILYSLFGKNNSPLVTSFSAVIYFGVVPSAFFVYLSNTYWLFPFKGSRTFFDTQVILRLLLSTFAITFPFIFLLAFLQKQGLENFFIYWAVQLLIVTPVSWVLYESQKDKILALRGTQNELARSKADLDLLRSQINPHFLFNALNTLYGVALQEGSERSAAGIQKLGDMMRFMLHDNTLELIPMSREINYLENYIALQKLRTQTSPDIIIEDNINGQNCDHQVAPMLLIPLVENAFKHGISLAKRSWIKIELTCDDTYIHFEVSNSMHIDLDSDPEKEQSGIGLENVKERLALLYPGRYKFSAKGDGKEFIAALNIQP